MATTSSRLTALEADVANLKAWKTAHLTGHVLSGHTHPGDATDADVAALDARIDALESEPTPDPADPPPVESPPPVGTPTLYGPGLFADTLANTTIGPNQNRIRMVFPALETGAITSIRWFQQGGGTYGSGNGGDIRLQLVAGASWSTSVAGAVGSGSQVGRLNAFPTPVLTVQGQSCFVEVSNASPGSGFTSVNALLCRQGTPSPKYAGYDFLLSEAGGAWKSRGYLPVFEVTYASGRKQGIGYMESWVETPAIISGASKVRQVFVPDRDLHVSKVSVRLARKSGVSPLQLDLVQGTTVLTGMVPGIPLGTNFGKDDAQNATVATIEGSVMLVRGIECQIIASCPADTQYSVFVLRKGSAYGYSAASYGPGSAQSTTGGLWTGFKGSTEGDLQWQLEAT